MYSLSFPVDEDGGGDDDDKGWYSVSPCDGGDVGGLYAVSFSADDGGEGDDDKGIGGLYSVSSSGDGDGGGEYWSAWCIPDPLDTPMKRFCQYLHGDVMQMALVLGHGCCFRHSTNSRSHSHS